MLHFLKDKGKDIGHIYSYRVCYTFILTFEFTLISLLYVLFILKVEGNFGKDKTSSKEVKYIIFFIDNIDKVGAVFTPSTANL